MLALDQVPQSDQIEATTHNIAHVSGLTRGQYTMNKHYIPSCNRNHILRYTQKMQQGYPWKRAGASRLLPNMERLTSNGQLGMTLCSRHYSLCRHRSGILCPQQTNDYKPQSFSLKAQVKPKADQTTASSFLLGGLINAFQEGVYTNPIFHRI